MGFGGTRNPTLDFSIASNNLFATEQQNAANEEAGLLREQANITFDEYDMEARRRAREIKLFRQSQAQGYNAAGVLTDSGSPLAVLDETSRLGQQEVDAIRRAGEARVKLIRYNADRVERQGLLSVLKVQGENLMARVQDDARRREEKAQFYRGLFGMGLSFGGSLFRGLFSSFGKSSSSGVP